MTSNNFGTDPSRQSTSLGLEKGSGDYQPGRTTDTGRSIRSGVTRLLFLIKIPPLKATLLVDDHNLRPLNALSLSRTSDFRHSPCSCLLTP
jgi:hypothetical protein